MEDPGLIRAKRFRLRAAECLALADLFEIDFVAERYREMARRYLDLAEHEEDLLLRAQVPKVNDREPPSDSATI